MCASCLLLSFNTIKAGKNSVQLHSITSGYCGTNNHIVMTIFKKNSFHRSPKPKPNIVSKVVNVPKSILGECSKKKKIEVLSEPIKSASDKKLYK